VKNRRTAPHHLRGLLATAGLGLSMLIGPALPLPAFAQGAAVAPVSWRGVERVVAFADVHGAYAELLTLLRETGIVDDQQRWAAGKTHVVSLGDLLDRGAGSRQVMDLLMRLQGEARAAGGQLHVVLGNHETMNLLGDLRYVDVGEYAAYADVESAAERAEQRRAWDAAQAAAAAATPPGAAPTRSFEQQFPPGYFGHRAALSAQGRYGQWLLSLPVAISIDHTLFMHAGPSKLLRGMSLQELNLRYRTALTDYLGLAERLARARLLQPGDDFHRRATLARERWAVLNATSEASGAAAAAELGSAVARFEAVDEHPLLSADGPNWHRGAALCKEAAEADVLLPLLQQFGVSRLVVGHTPTRDRRATTRFDGRVIKLDAGMNRAAYQGRAVALFLQPGSTTLRYAGERAATPLQAEALFVAPKEVDDTQVLAALQSGELTITGPRAPNELNVAVEHAGRRIAAVFQARSAGAARSEIAAYRLDRQLGLGLVPATVEREVQGQRGVLQARPQRWLTQTEVQREARRSAGWCDAQAQFQLVYAFDTLIGNERRSPDALLFDADAWSVFVTSHDRAFGSTAALPAYLRAQPPSPGAELRRRIAALTPADLAASLGELVDERGRRAILERRDVLLALPLAPSAPATGAQGR
jgi:Calcineurin-like phosphoesterase